VSAPRAIRGCGKDLAFVVIVGLALGLVAIVVTEFVAAVAHAHGWW
jgi:hypothetical protein